MTWLEHGLRRRLRAPLPGTSDTERHRLQTRIARLGQLFSWGDLPESDYRQQKADAEAEVAAVPDNDKLVVFHRQREVLLSMAENIEPTHSPQLQELVAERVETADKRVTQVVCPLPARPFLPRLGLW